MYVSVDRIYRIRYYLLRTILVCGRCWYVGMYEKAESKNRVKSAVILGTWYTLLILVYVI
jgi:hypothetical protein